MKNIHSLIRLFCIALIALQAISCHTTQELSKEATIPSKKMAQIDPTKLGGGSSGMTQVDDSTYLLVYDLKIFEKGTRLALLRIREESIEVIPISIDRWPSEGRSSDLESVSSIPGRPNEFLAAESGNWEGELGRIFHIKLDAADRSAQVLGSTIIPMIHRNDKTTRGDQYEAIQCLGYDQNNCTLLLGERGGSATSPEGVIRWGLYDLNAHTFTASADWQSGIKVHLPPTLTKKVNRSLSDFYLDPSENLWAVGTKDPGDLGPFYSVIYKLGKVNPNNLANPVTIESEPSVVKEISGFKIEALAGPPAGIDCTHSFSTEDEVFGGVWRPLLIKN